MVETSKASMELNDNNPGISSSSGSEDSERSGPVTSILEQLRAPKLSELSRKHKVARRQTAMCYQFVSFISSWKEL